MNIAKSLFSLVKNNNGCFVSEKQEKFLSKFFENGVYQFESIQQFGEFEQKTSQNTKLTKWSFHLDFSNNKISRVTKTTSKGEELWWEDSKEYELSNLKKEFNRLMKMHKNKIMEMQKRSEAFNNGAYNECEEMIQLYRTSQQASKNYLKELNVLIIEVQNKIKTLEV